MKWRLGRGTLACRNGCLCSHCPTKWKFRRFHELRTRCEWLLAHFYGRLTRQIIAARETGHCVLRQTSFFFRRTEVTLGMVITVPRAWLTGKGPARGRPRHRLVPELSDADTDAHSWRRTYSLELCTQDCTDSKLPDGLTREAHDSSLPPWIHEVLRLARKRHLGPQARRPKPGSEAVNRLEPHHAPGGRPLTAKCRSSGCSFPGCRTRMYRRGARVNALCGGGAARVSSSFVLENENADLSVSLPGLR
ncbi:hypothetical protein SAMN05216345_10992 [Cupriavidus sp. YR651]|nr:hypothetical protein SAMN05216345_10992 [Cupriavidus sp. YR651]